MHPFIQWLFLEFSNIQEAPTKRLATIFLAQEFDNIIQEARDIFAYYRINCEFPPIEGILYELEGVRKLRSTFYVAYDENLRKKVPPNVLVDKISEHNDQFAIPKLGMSYELERELQKYLHRNIYNEEIVITYEKPKEEPPIPPEIDLSDPCVVKFSPFNYFCLPIRKHASDRREYDYSMTDQFPGYYNT